MVINHRIRRPVGWRNESRRHSLASRGVKTAVPKSEAMMKPRTKVDDEEFYIDKEGFSSPFKIEKPKSPSSNINIKGWESVENDTYIAWSSASYPIEIGDTYTFIEFVKPKTRTKEIGYLYIEKKKVNWLGGGKAHGTTTIKEISSTHPLTREEGIRSAKDYMRANQHG